MEIRAVAPFMIRIGVLLMITILCKEGGGYLGYCTMIVSVELDNVSRIALLKNLNI